MQTLRVMIQGAEVVIDFFRISGRDNLYKTADGRVEVRYRGAPEWKNFCWMIDVNGPWRDDSNPTGAGPTLEAAVTALNQCLDLYIVAATFKKGD